MVMEPEAAAWMQRGVDANTFLFCVILLFALKTRVLAYSAHVGTRTQLVVLRLMEKNLLPKDLLP